MSHPLPEWRTSALAAHRSDHPSAFAVYVRMARAALGWNQCDLARLLGMTQRSINRIELGHCEPRRTTMLAMEGLLRKAGVRVEYGADGCVAVTVPASVIDKRCAVPGRNKVAARPVHERRGSALRVPASTVAL
ncbi:MAG: helix-turn-helix transcriptional regulator [Proteobacteria bacterium]|nr:helix-turn-helix transcriptional regulator [Pseudomonadota bacterium]